MAKRAPAPGALSAKIDPPLCVTIPYTVDSPSPVPLPFSFVVKNGSKRCESVSSSIPTPVSATSSTAQVPGLRPGRGARAGESKRRLLVAMVSVPPPAWRPVRSPRGS